MANTVQMLERCATSSKLPLYAEANQKGSAEQGDVQSLNIRSCCMRTRGETEAAICNEISSYEQEYMGRGPREVHAYFIDHLLVISLQGVLTAAEQNLVKTQPLEKGRDLLKQVRRQLIETARAALEAMIQRITGINPRSLHHDISTVTGEELVVFTLVDRPQIREIKRK